MIRVILLLRVGDIGNITNHVGHLSFDRDNIIVKLIHLAQQSAADNNSQGARRPKNADQRLAHPSIH
jgi:hypothetical protein